MATHAEGQEELIWCGRHNSDSRFGTQLFSITSVVSVYIVKSGLCLSRAVISLQANNYNSANRFLKANYFCPITAPLLPAGGRKANISKARGEAHLIGFQVSRKSFYQISNEFDYDAQQESCSTKYNLMCKKLTQPPVKVAKWLKPFPVVHCPLKINIVRRINLNFAPTNYHCISTANA